MNFYAEMSNISVVVISPWSKCVHLDMEGKSLVTVLQTQLPEAELVTDSGFISICDFLFVLCQYPSKPCEAAQLRPR